MIDDGINKKYKVINKYYKNINREMVDKVVRHLNAIEQVFFDVIYPNPNSKQINSMNSSITSKILNNDIMPEAATINTIMSMIIAMSHFLYMYKTNPHRLFMHAYLWSWMLFAVHEVNLKKLFTPSIYGPAIKTCINDDTIEEEVEEFLNVDPEDLRPYIDIKKLM